MTVSNAQCITNTQDHGETLKMYKSLLSWENAFSLLLFPFSFYIFIMSTLSQTFIRSPQFAVVGASTNRSKFGNRILRWYLF
jgi:hypothetical protein